MASNYGENFGFRRSDDTVRVSEGRFKTPAAAPALLIGTAVQIDPATPGYLKACAANAALVPGVAGILVQEERMHFSIYETTVIDSFSLGVAKVNTLSVVSTGAGVKVWYRNTPAQSRADGRVISAVTVFDPTGLAVGSQLGWDGAKFVKVNGTVTSVWATVTALGTNYVEAVLVA